MKTNTTHINNFFLLKSSSALLLVLNRFVFIRHYVIRIYILVAHNACFHSDRLHITLLCLCSDCLVFKREVVLSEITFSSSRWDFIWNLHDLRSFCERLRRLCSSKFYEFTYACGRVFLGFFLRLFIYFLFLLTVADTHRILTKILYLNITRFIK